MNGTRSGNLSIHLYLMIYLCLWLTFGLNQSAVAHQRSESFSLWQYSGDMLSVRFTISEREASRLQTFAAEEPLQLLLAKYLAGQIFVQNNPQDEDSACVLMQAFQALRSRQGYLQAEAIWQCRELPDVIAVHAFFDLAAEHSHFANFESLDGLSQRLLTAENRLWRLSRPLTDEDGEITRSPFKDYLLHGVVHIISGFDHLVFLVALLLVCRRGKGVVWAISGFTLGHSITLSLAAMGMVNPNVPVVEATIGLSIALVAVERTANSMKNTLPLAAVCAALLLLMVPWSSARDMALTENLLTGLALFSFCYLLLARELGSKGGFRILITALFGLVHGLGFAGAFMVSGLARNTLFLPLAGFNIGIELGQMALIVIMLSIGSLLKHQVRYQAYATELSAAVVCGLGVFWFVQRGLLY